MKLSDKLLLEQELGEESPKATSGYPDFNSARIGIESMLAMYGDLRVPIPPSLIQQSRTALQSGDLNYANIVASSIDEIGGKLLNKQLEQRPTTREDKEAVIRKAQAAYNRSDDEEAVVLLNSANIKGAFGGLVVPDDLVTMFGERDVPEPEPSKVETETSAPEKIKVGDIEYTRPDGFSDEDWREYTEFLKSKSQTK